MKVNVLGVPDSAAAYCVGVERAPAALRAAGLIEALTVAGCEVQDAGDLTTRRWTPDRAHPLLQNLEAETEAVVELRDAAAPLLEAGSRLIVLGGTCLVAVGVCAAMARSGERPRMVYIDRHLDLNTPKTTGEGSLSWMGMAHALRLPGTGATLTDALGPDPLLSPADLVYLGVDETQATSGEREHLQSLQIPVVDQATLVARPVAAARSALELLGPGPFVVHVDVDVLDFLDAPLAEDVNGRNRGPTIEQLGEAVRELVQQPDCWALSVGQLDPGHAESDPAALSRFVEMLVSAVQADSDSS